MRCYPRAPLDCRRDVPPLPPPPAGRRARARLASLAPPPPPRCQTKAHPHHPKVTSPHTQVIANRALAQPFQNPRSPSALAGCANAPLLHLVTSNHTADRDVTQTCALHPTERERE